MLISQIYYSLREQGVNIGTPSIFIKFFGCNFQCRGYGLPLGSGAVHEAVLPINPTETFKEFPVLEFGCDAYFSHLKPYEKYAYEMQPIEVVEEILSLLPIHNETSNFTMDQGQAINLVFSGGEPLLFQHQIQSILEILEDADVYNIEFDTNGTQPIGDAFHDYLKESKYVCTFSVSPKLSSSGEPWAKTIRPSVVQTYDELHDSTVVFNYTIHSESDMLEVNNAIDKLGIRDGIYMSSTNNGYQSHIDEIAKICMKSQYRFAPRIISPKIFRNEITNYNETNKSLN